MSDEEKDKEVNEDEGKEADGDTEAEEAEGKEPEAEGEEPEAAPQQDENPEATEPPEATEEAESPEKDGPPDPGDEPKPDPGPPDPFDRPEPDADPHPSKVSQGTLVMKLRCDTSQLPNALTTMMQKLAEEAPKHGLKLEKMTVQAGVVPEAPPAENDNE